MSIHDSSIGPRATGAATALVKAHSAPPRGEPNDQTHILYGGWFCPFVQRAWIVLEEKEIPYQYIEVNPYNKTPKLLAVNPRGLIPALAVPPLEHQNSSGRPPLYESTVICEYLDEAFPGSGERLLPKDVYERARCRLWMDHICGKIVPAWYKLMQHTEEKAYSLEEARQGLHKQVLLFANEMVRTEGRGVGENERRSHPWFLGGDFSMVDVVLAPWAARMWLIDYYKDGGCGFPDGKDDESEDGKAWGRWWVWLEAVLQRESVVKTSSEKEDYIGVYKRYADDTTQSEVAQATRLGGRLP